MKTKFKLTIIRTLVPTRLLTKYPDKMNRWKFYLIELFFGKQSTHGAWKDYHDKNLVKIK